VVNNVLWQPGQPRELVTPDNPLVGLEVQVLQAWLENSPTLAKAYKDNPKHRKALEQLARDRVEEARVKELQMRASGASLEEAHAESRPPMWTPPTVPPPRTSR
jgi:hypothetical protein